MDTDKKQPVEPKTPISASLSMANTLSETPKLSLSYSGEKKAKIPTFDEIKARIENAGSRWRGAPLKGNNFLKTNFYRCV